MSTSTACSDSGIGEKIGTVTITGTDSISLAVAVSGLPDGHHGFHLHTKGDCGTAVRDGKTMAGMAAGGHFDPAGTKSHKGPEGNGHKGDLPVLELKSGTINETVVAPHLKLADIRGHALVIHGGGDNYTDTPENGGGGARIACGVVPAK